MKKAYKIKEIFYTLQGEGVHTGRPAIFCRFSKCNLWNGREEDRESAICKFCDTDIVGTDGENGGVYNSATDLVSKILSLWPHQNMEAPFIVCTGGEPALQLDEQLVQELHANSFEVAIETNGTLPLPPGIDWVCCSPKGVSDIVIEQANELKIVFPQYDLKPGQFEEFKADYFFLTPRAPVSTVTSLYPSAEDYTKQTIEYCMENPKWRLNLQTHKVLNIA